MLLLGVQFNPIVGDIAGNTRRISATLQSIPQWESIIGGIPSLIIFPELSICGYPPLDWLEYPALLEACESALEEIAHNFPEMTILIGSPERNFGSGKPMYNSVFLLRNGKIEQTFRKQLLPTYDIFDEARYFQPGKETGIFSIDGQSFAVAICEDLWFDDQPGLYDRDPLKSIQADAIISISASPYSHTHDEDRTQIFSKTLEKTKLPILYINQVGANTDIIFDGRSRAINKQGNIVSGAAAFTEALLPVVFHDGDFEGSPEQVPTPSNQKEEDWYQALILGIRDFFQKNQFKKAILGLSGGIDSALVAVLAAEALGPENVLALLLPSEYSSDHSISDSLDLVKKIGINHEIVPIASAVQSVTEALNPAFEGLKFGIAEENLQSRIRGTILMAYTNKFGYILLNTSNKSELAVGYGTLYGDMNGGLGVIGDLYKTQIFSLCQYINRDKEIIPNNILTKEPSAELRPGQKDSDSLPPYEILDAILEAHLEYRITKNELVQRWDEALVNRVLDMVARNEYKRFQAPPQLRISRKAFGIGRRVPLVGQMPK
jgi:NAD+ synthase (glutamine-hydrolysing)